MSEELKGSISADISEDAVAAALAAVERSEAGEAEVTVVPEEGAAAAVEVAAAELASARKELERAEEAQAKLRADLEEAQSRLLRTAADLENARKRALREKDELKKFAAERLLKDLVPVVDNLDRALAAAAEDDPLSSGVRLVLKSFEDALGRHGVQIFSALGEPFDPRVHEAIMQVEGDAAPGTVVFQHGRGFLLAERLLRAALVGVAVARPAAPEASAVAAEEPGDAPAPAAAEPEPA
ncbi:MAG TPA: nucleotide exchange factor GrpE [Anaeromyxobacteraceae bacterium]|nr:nucleotide exchange factor GrpE [Anaeromyxobacteraceae bacterium]